MKNFCINLFLVFSCINIFANDFCWPVEGQNVNFNKDILYFIQPTTSLSPLSGTFGFVRNNGTRFHGGIDIKSTQKDQNGEPTDNVVAFHTGIVRYINDCENNSAYGKYIIIEHKRDNVIFYSLYAHLKEIFKDLIIGSSVQTGDAIAILGRTSNETTIDINRAHLHFEISFKLTDKKTFQKWYNSTFANNDINHHGEWNGMNFVKIDPISFFKQTNNKHFTIDNIFSLLKPDVCFAVKAQNIPYFLQKNNEFIKNNNKLKYNADKLSGWIVNITYNGVPISFEPIFVSLNLDNDVQVLSYNNSKTKELRLFDILSVNNKKIHIEKFLKKELAFFFNLER